MVGQRPETNSVPSVGSSEPGGGGGGGVCSLSASLASLY